MSVLTVSLDARHTVLGRYIGPGTPHSAIGVMDPKGPGFECHMRIFAPAALVDTIRNGFQRAYGLELVLDPHGEFCDALLEVPDRTAMHGLALSRALDGLHNHLLRFYGSVQGGCMTLRIETDLSPDQLRPFTDALRAHGVRERIEISAQISRQLDLSARWSPLLRAKSTA